MRQLYVFTMISMLILGLSTANHAFADGDAAAGKKVFERLKCAKCHGDDGKGNGPTAQKLKAKGKIEMHDWTDKAFMSKLTDEYLNDITAKGGKAIGKSKRMPSYQKKLKHGDLEKLLKFVRSFTQDVTASGQ